MKGVNLKINLVIKKVSWLNFMRPWHVPVCKMGYSRNIPYPDFFEKMYVPVLIWDIPYPRFSEELHVPVLKWDIPYPRILEELYVPLFFGYIPNPNLFQEWYVPVFYGISHIPNFQEKICTALFWDIQSTDFSIFFKLCIWVFSAVLSCPIQLPKLIHS